MAAKVSALGIPNDSAVLSALGLAEIASGTLGVISGVIFALSLSTSAWYASGDKY